MKTYLPLLSEARPPHRHRSRGVSALLFGLGALLTSAGIAVFPETTLGGASLIVVAALFVRIAVDR